MKVEVGDVFRRNETTMRIICTDRRCSIPIVALVCRDQYQNEKIESHTCEDIEDGGWVKVTPWDDFKIDEPVMVKNDSMTKWEKRHFAGISEDGRPMAWKIGRTSFTRADEPAPWHSCRRPEEEELRG